MEKYKQMVIDEAARKFYKVLEDNGQLVNVKKDTDLSSLSNKVTHIRKPDGSVIRLKAH